MNLENHSDDELWDFLRRARNRKQDAQGAVKQAMRDEEEILAALNHRAGNVICPRLISDKA